MDDPNPPRSEGPYALWVILAGIGAVTVVTIAALVRYADPAAIVTALGPVTGVIGTLVGAYFGLRGSSLAQQHASRAETARAAAAAPVWVAGNGRRDDDPAPAQQN